MKAWQVTKKGEPRDVLVQVDDAALPEPGPGLMRARVDACGVGLPDLLMCRAAYALTPPVPFTPGQEFSGVVTAAGEGAPAKVGDRIMAVSGFITGEGGFAEEAVALPDMCFQVPDWMSAETASGFLIPYHTGYIGLIRRGALKAGETVLVLGGAGGTGSAAIQLARSYGARVIATAGGPEKVAFCEELGADAVVDYRSESIPERVMELTDGHGADVIYDPVGGETFKQATRCVAHEGRILLVGFAGDGNWGRPSGGHMAQHNYSVVGVMPSGFDRAWKDASQTEMLALLKSGEIRVPIGRVFDFDDLPAALETLASGRVMGKLVVRGPA
jgi:NADPH2:quinone reductase